MCLQLLLRDTVLQRKAASFLHNSPTLETIQMPLTRRMDTLWHIYRVEYYSARKGTSY